MMIAKKAVNSFVRTSFESNSIKDDLFLRELVDSLALSGIANEIAGNSAPSSGSEHLISHALDKILEVPQLHGIQVGLATYLMSLVQNHRYKRIHTIFTNTGFFDYAGDVRRDNIFENTVSLYQKYDRDKELRKARSIKMQQMVDGKGAGRIAKILLENQNVT